jgi:hypothetical protein
MILQAHTISSLVRDRLSIAGRTGSVHSVFGRALNVLCDDSPGPALYMSVHAPGAPMHPFAVLLRRHPGWADGPGFIGARVGERAVGGGEKIVLGEGRVTIELDRAQVWNPLLEPLGDVPRGAGPAAAILETLHEREINSPFLRPARCGGGVESALTLRCGRIRRDLAAAWRLGDTGKACRAMQSAVGLGSGLTPSGDDFLVGFLGAAHMFAFGGGTELGVRRGLCIRRSMTTLPSYFMLRGAVSGFLPEPLSDLLRAVAVDDPRRVRNSAGRLAGLGATSGQDMLAGVLCYLEAARAARETE